MRFPAITRDANGNKVGADLVFRDADEASTDYLRKVWEKLSLAVRNHHDIGKNSEECPTWAAWRPLEWSQQNIPARQKFVAWYGDTLAGFVNLQPGFASQYETEVQVLYLEHMAAFPGYLNSEIWTRKLSFMGVPLLAFAVFQSAKQGFNGRIGLHIDPGATKFYDNLIDILGFPVFHPSKHDINGPHPHLERSKKYEYREVTLEAASQVLEGHHV